MTSLKRIRSRDAEANYSSVSPFGSGEAGWHPHVLDGGLLSQPLPAKLPKLRRRKRLFDLVVGSALLVFLAPLMGLIAALVKLDGGPAVFGHRRVGADGRSFRCWKFRSMVPNADEVLTQILESDPAARAEWERDFKLRADPRITRIGRLLRVTSLDELPQLFNVLAGEMSLIGPRPIVAEEVARYGDAYRYYCACRPGMTGMWQVSGRNRVDYRRRVAYDQQYAANWSFLLDLSVLCRTVVVVTLRSGAY